MFTKTNGCLFFFRKPGNLLVFLISDAQEWGLTFASLFDLWGIRQRKVTKLKNIFYFCSDNFGRFSTETILAHDLVIAL
jgi:hypothetical protein